MTIVIVKFQPHVISGAIRFEEAGYRKGLVSAGWAVFSLSCTNEHRKQSIHLVGTPFLAF